MTARRLVRAAANWLCVAGFGCITYGLWVHPSALVRGAATVVLVGEAAMCLVSCMMNLTGR